MRKAPIALAIVLILAAFAAADFYLNGLGKGLNLDFRGSVPAETGASPKPIPVDSLYKVGDEVEGYKVASVVAASQIFDKIDLSSVKNIQVVKTVMKKEAAPVPPKPGQSEAAVSVPEPITFYEIRGAKDQGSLTYLSVKLQFVAQLNSLTENLNETNAYGDGSFYYNDLNNPETAFLLVQIGDNLYGFQSDKKSEAVPHLINGLEKK
ncbi:hypothetical protein HZA44_01110 [Candidatus Peregrinibacteria bacterium]|nr:hypothetical protein [Candidatus Peregrinibacteria bacterium]